MWRAVSVALMLTFALGLALAPAADAGDVQGKIAAVDPAGSSVTLDNGVTLIIPPDVKVSRESLRPGATVKASYEDKAGDKTVKSIQVVR